MQALPGDADLKSASVVRQGVFSGARVLALNPALADSLGGDPFASGVIIAGVERGGYAARSGLRQGDVIVSVAGRRVAGAQQLQDVPRGVEVVIERGGRRLNGVMR